MARYLHLEDMASPLAGVFGQRLKAKRQERKLTIARLSEATAVAVSHISLLERGKGNPTLSTMEALCAALGVSVSEMLAGDSEDLGGMTVRI